MSKRAEQAALKAYPEKIIDHVEEPGFVVKRDLNRFDRNVYIQGYEQAEKDLALTWRDIELIVRLNEEVMAEAGGTPKDYDEEVLRRFNEQRNRQ